jgi:hypothetical protein
MEKIVLLFVLVFGHFSCNLCANSRNAGKDANMKMGNLTINEAKDMCNKTFSIKAGSLGMQMEFFTF